MQESAAEAHSGKGRICTSTFIAALRCDRIDAPWVFDGPIEDDVFRTCV